MKRFVSLFCVLASTVATAGTYESPGRPEPGDAHYDLEELYAAAEFKKGLEETKARIAATPDDPELYWHGSRFMFEIGEQFERTDSRMDKKRWYQDLVAMSQKGLDIAPDHPHLKFTWAVGTARLATTKGVLKSLFTAKTVEKTWIEVAESGFRYESLDGNEILPCDVFLTLGIFYRMVPDSMVVKALAGTKGDLKLSLDWHMRSNRCRPGRIGSIKELGVTQLCLGKKKKDQSMLEKGRRTLRDMQKLPSTTATDDIDKRHGLMLIDEPSLACEYSRDGQQDYEKDSKSMK